ncbi:DNA alkylation repair protein [Arthrobacter sp. OY3WO11]|uniref:DNA alkylation repair protein n=1 Tax=Arthrobacter sp. OY3WO11 TaxID=1835723 RepID=UPI0007CEFF52|nr:DNA alkylation repair protein [Arthrobacter sp. OY3WO11]OAE02122.1 DNA alkylation repair protein [Arthrobacter sp. OY3WO11]
MNHGDAVNVRVLSAIRTALQERADPVRGAGAMAYMKSTMPCLGVRVPEVRRIASAGAAGAPFESADQLRATALELWRGAASREERYAAIDLTANGLVAGDMAMLPVYEEFVRSGAWWDFVDGTAGRLCGLLQANRAEMTGVLLRWSTDPDFWIRRAAILSQLKAKAATDSVLLTRVVEANLADPEFFIRKAIGWALREYGKTDAGWVAAFVAGHAAAMSPLTRREAVRHLAQVR